MEEVVGAAVELGHGDDVVTAARDVHDGVGDGRLTRRMGEGGGAAFEGGDALLEHVSGRVHDPGVEVAQFFQGKQIGGVFGAVEHVAGGLVVGDRASVRGRIGRLPGVNGFGAETLRSRHRERGLRKKGEG